MFLFTLGCLFALVLGSSTEKCKFELQNVLADPQTYSQNYLRTLSGRLAQFTNLLFTNQANSIVDAFEQEYGVNVQLKSPFPTCQSDGTAQACYSLPLEIESATLNGEYPFAIPQSGPITSISITNIIGQAASSKKSMLDIDFFTISLQPPGLIPAQILVPACQVPDTQNFNFGLSDTSTTAFSCDAVDSATVLLPTSPLSQFNGLEANGEWKLIISGADIGFFTGFTFNYCVTGSAASSTPTCSVSSDIARANINVPGYRYDATDGNVYYTTILRSAQGQELYATISRSVEGMFIKK